MHGCILWQENAKTEDKKLEKYKNKILGQNICKPQTQNKPCPFQHRNHFHQGWLTLTHSSSVSPVYLYLEFVQLCVPIIQLYRCLLRVAHLSPLLLWLFVYPNKLHCSSYLADRKQGQSWCAAPWHHFLCLWEKCTCREAWGPPAELPGLPVTAWRHTVVEYPAVKFDPDPLESSCLSLLLTNSSSHHHSLSPSHSLCLFLPPFLFLFSTAVSSFIEGAGNKWFLLDSSVCAFVCFECVLLLFLCACTCWAVASFLFLKMRTRSSTSLVNCIARCFILICHSLDLCRGVLLLICPYSVLVTICSLYVWLKAICIAIKKSVACEISPKKGHANIIKSSFLRRAGPSVAPGILGTHRGQENQVWGTFVQMLCYFYSSTPFAGWHFLQC